MCMNRIAPTDQFPRSCPQADCDPGSLTLRDSLCHNKSDCCQASQLKCVNIAAHTLLLSVYDHHLLHDFSAKPIISFFPLTFLPFFYFPTTLVLETIWGWGLEILDSDPVVSPKPEISLEDHQVWSSNQNKHPAHQFPHIYLPGLQDFFLYKSYSLGGPQ